MIATCSAPDDIYSSRWEFVNLKHANVPKDTLDYLIRITDAITAWQTERIHISANSCYIHPWTWQSTETPGVYKAVLHYGTLPRDPVMCYLREHYTGNEAYPAALELVCAINTEYPDAQFHALVLADDWEKSLTMRLEELVAHGDREYKIISSRLA